MWLNFEQNHPKKTKRIIVEIVKKDKFFIHANSMFGQAYFWQEVFFSFCGEVLFFEKHYQNKLIIEVWPKVS